MLFEQSVVFNEFFHPFILHLCTALLTAWSFIRNMLMIGWTLACTVLIIGWRAACKALMIGWTVACIALMIGWSLPQTALTIGWSLTCTALMIGWTLYKSAGQSFIRFWNFCKIKNSTRWLLVSAEWKTWNTRITSFKKNCTQIYSAVVISEPAKRIARKDAQYQTVGVIIPTNEQSVPHDNNQ